jgi:hypothetical protein
VWNVGGHMRVGIFTARAVAADTELTFDYKWPRSSDRAPTTCMCGAPSCRGTLEVKPRRRNDGEVDVDVVATDAAAAGAVAAAGAAAAAAAAAEGNNKDEEEEEEQQKIEFSFRDTGSVKARGRRSKVQSKAEPVEEENNNKDEEEEEQQQQQKVEFSFRDTGSVKAPGRRSKVQSLAEPGSRATSFGPSNGAVKLRGRPPGARSEGNSRARSQMSSEGQKKGNESWSIMQMLTSPFNRKKKK